MKFLACLSQARLTRLLNTMVEFGVEISKLRVRLGRGTSVHTNRMTKLHVILGHLDNLRRLWFKVSITKFCTKLKKKSLRLLTIRFLVILHKYKSGLRKLVCMSNLLMSAEIMTLG